MQIRDDKGSLAIHSYIEVRDEVLALPHAGVGCDHELGDALDVAPGADVSVIGNGVRGEAGAKEVPVACVHSRRVADQDARDLADLVSHFIDLVARVSMGSSFGAWHARAMFTMRFDMRAPSTGASASELYAAALEMATWSESRGAVAVIVSEHHVTGDGYLPSPVILATAVAARTSRIHLLIAALVLPLYNPVRLAEEMIVLDIISGGRVSYVAAVGYRPEEYELYGVDFHGRGRIADDQLRILLQAKTGGPFRQGDQVVQLMPAPVTPGGPRIALGGGSIAAARRAGRHGLDFFAQSDDPAMREAYEAEARANGHDPGHCMLPPADTATTMFVSDDLDRAWEELGPYLMHDAQSYASINEGNSGTASLSFASSADELRAENRSHRIVTVEEAVAIARSGVPLPLHPLIGGLPPEVAWRYLRTVSDVVMPSIGTGGAPSN